MAQFRPSGTLLRVDADQVDGASGPDPALWSEPPRPLFSGFDALELRRPQGPRSGIASVHGDGVWQELSAQADIALS
jgi:hypothetical protein